MKINHALKNLDRTLSIFIDIKIKKLSLKPKASNMHINPLPKYLIWPKWYIHCIEEAHQYFIEKWLIEQVGALISSKSGSSKILFSSIDGMSSKLQEDFIDRTFSRKRAYRRITKDADQKCLSHRRVRHQWKMKDRHRRHVIDQK